ncbi:hypothetical protein [Flavobacterium sp.]|uniref:hypothetical protein n=1 Tax=Flavobacterium sp. TaxID=239 RepID=UPI004034F49F
MQVLSNFFTGTENLFKLFFINGLILILVGLLYPLQKSNELDIQIVEHNNGIALLNKDISILKDECKTAYEKVLIDSVEQANIEKLIRHTKNYNAKKSLIAKSDKLKSKTVEISNQIEKKVIDQEKKVIEKENNRKRIERLKAQQTVYDNYCSGFLMFGIFISTIGLIGWSILTYFVYFKEYAEYKTLPIGIYPSKTKVILSILFIILIAASLALCIKLF